MPHYDDSLGSQPSDRSAKELELFSLGNKDWEREGGNCKSLKKCCADGLE